MCERSMREGSMREGSMREGSMREGSMREAARQQSVMNAKIESRMIFLRLSIGARSAVRSMLVQFLRLVRKRRDTTPVRSGESMPPVLAMRQPKRGFPLHSRAANAIAAALAMCCIHASAATPEAAAAATPEAAAAATPPNTEAAANQRPSEVDALAAYLAARAWLDADALPSEDSPEARVPLTGVTAACVLLRLDGRLVASGEAALPTPTLTGASANEQGVLLRRAVGRAVAKALSDSTIASVRAAVGDKVTARLSLEVELAGPVRPLIGRTIAEASLRVAAGDEGLALLRAERCYRAYPSRLLAADIASRPDRAITALLLEAGLPVKDLNAFTAEERVSLGRFDTIRLRADSPAAAPSTVTRAGRVIETFELSPRRLQAMSAQLASRLAGQVVARVPGDAAKGVALLGTLNPTADAYAPPFATTRDAALGALALAAAARSAEIPAATRARAQAQSDALVGSLVSSTESTERDAAVDCLLALAARTHPDTALRARLASHVATHDAAEPQDPSLKGAPPKDAPPKDAPPKDPVLSSLLAGALLASGGDAEARRASEIVRNLLARHAGARARLVDAAMPLAFVAIDPKLDRATRDELVALFGEFSTLARALQIRPTEPEFAALSADLEGGLLLPDTSGGMPDTQCLPLATALALVERQLPPEGRDTRLASGLLFARFLAQHVADDPWVGGFRNPGALRGLVRGDLSSDDCPPGPTAAGLLLALAVSENASRFAADVDGKTP